MNQQEVEKAAAKIKAIYDSLKPKKKKKERKSKVKPIHI